MVGRSRSIFAASSIRYENVNILPKPVQRPHPPIWVGATRNEETFRWAGEKDYDLMTVPFVHPIDRCVARSGKDLSRRAGAQRA